MAVVKIPETNQTIVVHDVDSLNYKQEGDEIEKITHRCIHTVKGEKDEAITEKIMLGWCVENLTEDVVVSFLNNMFLSYFESDVDAMTFKLRWTK